ncbi:hypothetical protein TorRG33x02_221680 [Trema orientale]|uniref:Uncharacterized protein n=1 Tax=Trema orientale TaxID=63057 RepID=A0A2P5E951_TREOI|nr:hypothetical protein TorRG33x02_221680 [Trema orientale]
MQLHNTDEIGRKIMSAYQRMMGIHVGHYLMTRIIDYPFLCFDSGPSKGSSYNGSIHTKIK